MPASDDLYPPVQYAPGWLLLALGVIALVLAAVWLVLLLTRPRAGGVAPPPPVVADAVTMLRHEYLDGIQRIEDDYRAGRIDARRANLELSRTARAFVNEHSGLEAPVLTLDDLVARGVHPSLIDALHRHYYPSIFGRGPAIDPIAGAHAARRVVGEWR
ncbi:hypothetical protein [Microbacterium marinilacus]|uniref:DUF4129 domain-containing protein n=1 Tax=Microbacterium marinilacus TaxID=415209 RepID=A0ABP7BTU4_9MICO|nr:hypothetical protein [Microbacterium marinilacus]MBY0688249.1 hypothetical protein [Microbacterium marinilacus]